MADYIYALTSSVGSFKFAFYVGHTNDPARRLREHKSAARTGTEDKYTFIRTELEPAGLDWTLEVLRTIPDGEIVEDYERWHVIEQIRLGNPIQNMKHGDARQQAAAWEDVHDQSIQSPEDITRLRIQRESKLEIEREAAEQSRAERLLQSQADQERKERLARLKHAEQARAVDEFVSEYGDELCWQVWKRRPTYREVQDYLEGSKRDRAGDWLRSSGVWRNKG
jgi:hypothetical protein